MQHMTSHITAPAQPAADLRPLVSVISPCYNESAACRLFLVELCKTLDSLTDFRFEILIVDDGSNDDTVDRLVAYAADDPRLRIIALSRNYGHQAALSAGLDQASGAAAILLDSDLQHPPTLIPRLLESWEAGSDIVSAVRVHTAQASIFKNATSRTFYRVFNMLSDTPIVSGAADFVLLSRPAYVALRSLPERHRFLRGMISWIGFKRAYVEYEASARVAGNSKYTTAKMIRLAVTAALSFSSMPLRLAGRFGIACSLLGFVYLAYIIGRWAIYGDLVPGWASTIGICLLLSGTQLIFIGIIGHYMSLMFDEAKGRPVYLLRDATRSGRSAAMCVRPPQSNGARLD